MRDPCSQLESIVADHFGFLLAERGYGILSRDSDGGNGCAIVLEGNSVRVKIYTAQDEPLNVLVGDGSAPTGWEESISGERKWHYLTGVAGYIEGDLSVGERVALMSREEWTTKRGEEPSRLSALLKAHIVEIERLFGAGEFERVREDYDQYRVAADARTRAALDAKARES